MICSAAQRQLWLIAVLGLPHMLLHLARGQSLSSFASATDSAAPVMCPLTARDVAIINYRPVRTACDASQLQGEAFCISCICAVGVANLLGFEAAGAQVHGQRVSQLAAADYPAAVGAVSMLANTCMTVLGAKLLESGALSLQALTALGGCSMDMAGLQCAEPDWAAAAAITVTRRGVPSAAQAAAAVSAAWMVLAAAAATAAAVLTAF